MLSSRDAADTRAAMQPSSHADQLSFPPTQRFCLLSSPTYRQQPAAQRRSCDQRANLVASYRKLLDALSAQPLRHAAAL